MEITNNIGRDISWALRPIELYEEELLAEPEEQLEAIKAIAQVVQTTLIDELTGWWNAEAFDYFVKELNTLMVDSLRDRYGLEAEAKNIR